MEVWIQAGTDNKSNEALLKKRSTTRWPLLLVNMQLSSLLMEAGLRLMLKWRPRDENAEADDLTNGRYDRFLMEDRVAVSWSDVDLQMLEQLWRGREEFLDRQSWKFYTGSDEGPYEKTKWGD